MRRAEDEDVTLLEDAVEGRQPVVDDIGVRGDDPRASLSYKLRKLLQWAGARVVCTDPYVTDDRLTTLDCVLEESDILVLGAPHKAYSALPIGGRDVVDIWGALGEGIRL